MQMCSCAPNTAVGERRTPHLIRNLLSVLFTSLKGKLELSVERLKSRKDIVGKSFLHLDVTDDISCASIINNFWYGEYA